MIFKNQFLAKAGDLIVTALYYFAVWAAGMAFMNRYLGLW